MKAVQFSDSVMIVMLRRFEGVFRLRCVVVYMCYGGYYKLRFHAMSTLKDEV